VDDLPDDLQPAFLIAAYRAGYFPMDDGPDASGEVRWYEPDPRAVLPLHNLHVGRTLARTLRNHPFELRTNGDFEQVVRACARPRDAEDGVWISERFVRAYCALQRTRNARSFEAWQDGKLVGGLYGVQIGRAFFAESMFHTARDAGNVVLCWSAAFVAERGTLLYDVQFTSDHLERLGVVEIPLAEYRNRLALATELKMLRPEDLAAERRSAPGA
jgi:leucyl/phenylalanyl-tRNA--protein transferase